MASDKFKVKGLTDVRLRSDGQEISLIFETAQRTKLTLIVPGWAMRNLAHQMMQFDRQALIKRQIPQDADEPDLTIDAPPPIFFVAPSGLQCVVRPDTNALDLQLQDVMHHEIQVCLLAEHVEALMAGMRQVQEKVQELQDLDDDRKPN